MRTVIAAVCFIFLFGAAGRLHAQDKLVLRNGRTVEVKVLRSSEEEDVVKYIYPSETTVYERSKSVISYILYEDGRKEVFESVLNDSERISSRPSSQTPSRAATSTQTPAKSPPPERNQTPASQRVGWEDIKTTFLDTDVKNMTRLKRINASSNISYKDALQQLKKQAATLGATTILIMDVPENNNSDDIEVVGVAFRDESRGASAQTNRPQSNQPAVSSSTDRTRRVARITENYNNNSQLIIEDAPPRKGNQTTQPRTTTPANREPAAVAQESEDVIYLLNGRVVKGSILEFEPDDLVSIRNSAGRIYE
jgi:hypothetical protein